MSYTPRDFGYIGLHMRPPSSKEATVTIYYVEDETAIADLTVYALKQAGLDAMAFSHARDFFAACDRKLPELVLLDIMLPDIDGLEILRRLRANPTTQGLPVMMLTAKGSEIDTVYGLDTGADDYLAKPFGMMELVSRTKALLRRSQQSPGAAPGTSSVLACGPIALDPAAHSATVNGVPLELTPKEFELLRALITNPGHVLTRAQLFERAWDTSYVGSSRTVDTHVLTLRQKLDEAASGTGELVQTVRGVGYRMKATD